MFLPHLFKTVAQEVSGNQSLPKTSCKEIQALTSIQISMTFGTFLSPLGKCLLFQPTSLYMLLSSSRRYSLLQYKMEDKTDDYPPLYRGKRFFPVLHSYYRGRSQNLWTIFSRSTLTKQPDVVLVTVPWTMVDFIPKL